MRDRDAVLTDHGSALGLQVEVSGPASAACLRWPLGDLPTVSIVVPNRNAFAVLDTCGRGVLDGTSYPNRELVVVDNGSTDAAVLALYGGLERERRGRIVPFDRPFNFSAACNAGAAAATGDLLWQYSRRLPQGVSPSHKRSLAIYGSHLFVPTSDAHMVALDVKTGRLVWDHAVGDPKQGVGIVGGPLVARGKVYVGNSPDLLVLEDTNGDDRADRRSSCACTAGLPDDAKSFTARQAALRGAR